MYIAKRTGFFTTVCQTSRVYLEEGKPIPEKVKAESIKRFLEIGAIEKVADDFVQETKPSKAKKETKAKPGGEKKDPEGDQGDDQGDQGDQGDE